MSYLQWTLDIEEEIDPYDPLGEIAIIGEEGKLEDKCTYLGVFFEALIQGIESIAKGKIIEIDIIVEPNYLIFDYTEENQIISYGKQFTTISNKAQFIIDTKEAVKILLTTLDNAAIAQKQEKPKLMILRNFLDNS